MTQNTFANPQTMKTIDTSEIVLCGQFQPSANINLIYTTLWVIKVGTAGGSESFTLGIHGSSDTSSAIYTSDPLLISTIQGASELNTTGSWASWLRFDFCKQGLDKDVSYYVSLSIASYTRNADTDFISVPYDFDFPVYDRTITNQYDAPAGFRVYGDSII